MKNKLNKNNLVAVYYDSGSCGGSYDLEFCEEGKQIIVTNVRATDHPCAAIDESYFDSDEVIKKIIESTEDKDIKIDGEYIL